jgi:hypothetical protein
VFDLDHAEASVVAVHDCVDHGFSYGGLGQVGELKLLASGEVDRRSVQAGFDEVEGALDSGQQRCGQVLVDEQLARGGSAVDVGELFRLVEATGEQQRTRIGEGPARGHQPEHPHQVRRGQCSNGQAILSAVATLGSPTPTDHRSAAAERFARPIAVA